MPEVQDADLEELPGRFRRLSHGLVLCWVLPADQDGLSITNVMFDVVNAYARERGLKLVIHFSDL